MAAANRHALRWLAYPGTMVAAFAVHAALSRAGAPIVASSYVAAVAAAAAVTLLERVVPYDRSWFPSARDVATDLLFMVTVQMALPPVLSLLAGVSLIRALDGAGLAILELWPHHLPIALQVTLMLLVAELGRYWLHVLAHDSRLWRLHAVHHSVDKLYWLNVGRFHPLEKALQFLFDALPFILLGVGEEVLALYFVFYAVNGFFQHSNVDARHGPLNYVIATAELHRWHHSKRIEESKHNYGNNLIVWDLVFGTWYLPKDRRVTGLGLLEESYPRSFLGQLASPFVRAQGDPEEPPGPNERARHVTPAGNRRPRCAQPADPASR